MMKFDVIDSGVGLTPEQKLKLESFQPFAQVEGASGTGNLGIGLGLRISNSLVTMLGGEIEIHSEKDCGSTFSMTVSTGYLNEVKMLNEDDIAQLTKERGREESKANSNKKPLEGFRILIAEDGKENQKLISYHLTKAGAEVEVADNGLIALEKVEQAVEPFHVIFMDMQMPELDGYGATRQLREQGYKLPVIALTANALDGDRLKCIVAGCDDYVSKPIDVKSLIELSKNYSGNYAQLCGDGPLQLM